MKNLNEDINRLRQIMSYDRSRSLLISESQYSIEDSIELEEQEVDYDPNINNFIKDEQNLNNKSEVQNGFSLTADEILKIKELAKSVANQIYNASKGMATDEGSFLDAVKSIDSLATLKFVNDFLKQTDYGNDDEGFEYFINDEFGREDADVVSSIVRHLNSFGAESEHKTDGRNFVGGSFKFKSSLDDIYINEIPSRDKGKQDDSNEPTKGEEPSKGDGEGCPTEEDILSGKVVLSKNSMNGKKCDVVTTVQNSLLKKLGKQEGGMSLRDEDFGIYGPKTIALVVAFQSLNGLKVDGIVGQNTMKALLS